MNVLYLCNKKYVDHKMSRGRFHVVEAIGEKARAEGGGLDVWGIGWPGFDNDRTVNENLAARGKKNDAVIGYMPFEMKGFGDVPTVRVMSYNEMYNTEKVEKQLEASKPDLVICHHANEMAHYAARFPKIRFVNIPHCAKASIFYDRGGPKTTDVLVVGRLSSERYPLRTRMSELVKKLPPKYVTRVHAHPGYEIETGRLDEVVESYAKALSDAKICVTCSGTPRTRYAKYVEIPRAGAVLCADIPDDEPDFFRQFTIEIDASMTDSQILAKLQTYLENEEAYEGLRKKGKEMSERFTQEYYAARFFDALKAVVPC